jgi:hypothetical protein
MESVVPIIKLRPKGLPDNIETMSIDTVLIYEGIDIQPGDKILRVNTNLGKRHVVSLIHGKVCGPLPTVGGELSKSIPHFITLDVEEELDLDQDLFSYLDIDESQYVSIKEAEVKEPVESQKKSSFKQNEAPKQPASDSEDDKIVEEEQPAKEGGILAPILIGGLAGLSLTYAEEDFLTGMPVLMAFMLLFFGTVVFSVVRSSFKSGFYGACFFVVGCFIFPKIPIVQEMAFKVGDTAFELIYDYKRDREREKQHQLDVAYQQAVKQIEEAKQKANREITTENFRWDQEKWHDDYGKIDFVVINNSDNPLLSLEVDLYQVGIWREVTFSPPLNANTSRNMSFVVPTDIDGYPIETKHKPKKERQTLWYNNHRNIEFVAQQ